MNKLLKKWFWNVSGRASRLEFFIIMLIAMTALFLVVTLSIKIFEFLWSEHANNFYTKQYVESATASLMYEYFITGNVDNTSNTLAQDYQSGISENMFLPTLCYLLFILFAVLLITGAVRRLHDIGTFGWWVLIVVAPIWLFFDKWIIIAPLLFLFFKDGQRFYNKYGPDPKNPNMPIPLELPKTSERLSKFESDFLKIVENVRILLKPYLDSIVKKFKK